MLHHPGGSSLSSVALNAYSGSMINTDENQSIEPEEVDAAVGDDVLDSAVGGAGGNGGNGGIGGNGGAGGIGGNGG